jgi:hypothetical protein
MSVSETIKITYQVEYFCDEILKDMLDSGEYGLGQHPINDDAIVYNALDRFITMDAGIPLIPSALDQAGVLTVEYQNFGDDSVILYQFPGYNTLAQREDDHDSRLFQ